MATLLAGCGTPPPSPTAATDTGLDRMERLTLLANRCWFQSNDPAFATYTLAPELSSYSGRPRFLLVPHGQPEARPLLVVEGQSGARDVAIYGPLSGKPDIGPRIHGDLDRWGHGSDACSA
ncbi:hypothetical protein [Consotaella aegiceratis]|uniref:hypothetical protein n=1 Tax=Consotaella aegiceratis TaxID=3097961 RepID=UPI002F40303A